MNPCPTAKEYLEMACAEGQGDRDGCATRMRLAFFMEDNGPDTERFGQLSCGMGDFDACVEMGTIIKERGRLQDSKVYYEAACAQGQGDPRGCNGRGMLALDEDNGEEATRWFDLGCRVDHKTSCANLGATLYGLGKVPESFVPLRQACDDGNGEIVACYNLKTVEDELAKGL